ncbi:MAG: YlmH/Sll1252 family protein [Lachnospiraceae bacterium]|nr:YlmH/Sll1252 family protein [Lachnospiraceae bacterium]
MDTELLKKRLRELDHMVYQRDIPANTGFLTPEEQDVFLRMQKELKGCRNLLWGGFETAERKAAFFLPSYADEEKSSIPLSWLKIEPVNERFADELTHRDYLGALMSLGIERDRTGDIVINGKTALVVCLPEMAEYLCENLTSVRHTKVTCTETELPEALAAPTIEEVTGSVASPRLDAVAGFAFHMARGVIQDAVKAGYVYVNGRQVTSPGTELKEQDLVSVRHRGKFIYYGVIGKSKKDRAIVRLGLYR